jgi:protein TonB
MFEQSMINGRKARPWTFSVSTVLQVVVVGIAVLAPLMRIEALPPIKLGCDCRLPPRGVKIVSTEPMRSAAARTGSAMILSARTQPRPFTAPSSIPQGVPTIIDETAPDLAGGPSLPTGHGGEMGVPGGFGPPGGFAALPRVEPPKLETTPAPAAVPTPPRAPVRVGGDVRSPRLIQEVKPPYPRMALAARVQGTVRIEAILSRDGSVQSMRVVSGHPLLVPAALDAVRQWRYEPTLLNNVPVDVSLAIEVNFTLN